MPEPHEQWQWNDLYFRSNFQDTGLYPTSGTLSASPDVIPAGGRPFADPGQLVAGENWDVDFGGSADALEPNYIYLRGQNLGAGRTSGRLYLYASPASLLMYPTDPLDPTKGWSHNPLRTSSGAEYVTVEPGAGDRFVTPEPFQWIPQPLATDHYCLVGRVVTGEHPNEIPATGNLNDFARYISEHPDLAWRNVATVNPSSPVWSMAVEYDQGLVGGDMFLNLVCENAPDGSMVSFSSGTGGPEPPITLPKTLVQNQMKDGVPTFTATLYTKIPARYRTNVTYTWYSEGRNPLPDMKFTLYAILPAGPGSSWDPDLVRYSQPVEAFGIEPALGGVGPVRGILVGSQTMRAAPVAAALPGSGRQAQPVRSALEASGSSLVVAGFTVAAQRSSILSSGRTDYQASIARGLDKGVPTEVLRIAERPGPAEPAENADLAVDVDLNVATYGGDTFVVLKTDNVPQGCEVWFASVDSEVVITVPPTVVSTSPAFTVSALVVVPEEYQGRLRVFLRLNGNTLPADWSMQLSVLHVELPGGEPAAPAPRVLVNAGPVPGVLLGSVTVAR